jgi:hypothetical protein
VVSYVRCPASIREFSGTGVARSVFRKVKNVRRKKAEE